MNPRLKGKPPHCEEKNQRAENPRKRRSLLNTFVYGWMTIHSRCNMFTLIKGKTLNISSMRIMKPTSPYLQHYNQKSLWILTFQCYFYKIMFQNLKGSMAVIKGITSAFILQFLSLGANLEYFSTTILISLCPVLHDLKLTSRMPLLSNVDFCLLKSYLPVGLCSERIYNLIHTISSHLPFEPTPRKVHRT